MSASPGDDVTQLLRDPQLTSAERAQRLLPLVYEHLRGIARQRMAAERADHTLQPTALVHEAYLRLVGERDVPWQNRAHFFVAAAEAMRLVLLDHAKAHGRLRRSGQHRRVPLSLADLAIDADSAEILSLDEAICRLIGRDPDIGQVVRLRFYAGLSIQETASALAISPATVKRRWEFARTWLFRELNERQDRADHESSPPEP